MRDVRDGAPVGRAQEGVAWLMIWHRILADQQNTKAQNSEQSVAVTQLELNSRPQSFRGKKVAFRGHVRSARMQTVKNHELGIEKYYILWIKPEEKSTFPYCVYALDLPNGFPPVQRETVEMNEKVQVTGTFFKVRSYQAKGGLRECPLVLADMPEWMPGEKDTAAETPVVIPSWPVMAGALCLIALGAAGLAFLVYRTTSTPRAESAEAEAEISKDIEALQHNPAVETVSDRLRKMSENSR